MLRVGIDLTTVSRFEFIGTPGGEAFYRRAFTSAEQAECRWSPALVAACFAAKEAVSKVLGTGLCISGAEQLPCTSIQISAIKTRRPAVSLYGRAREIAESLGIDHVALLRGELSGHVVAYSIGATGIPAGSLQHILAGVHRGMLHRARVTTGGFHAG